MKINYPTKLTLGGLIVVPVFSEYLKKMPAFLPKEVKDFLKNRDFKAKAKEELATFLLGGAKSCQLLILGAGSTKDFNYENALKLGGLAGQFAKSAKERDITILLNAHCQKFGEQIVEGLLSAQYNFALYRSVKKSKKPYKLENLNLISENADKDLKPAIERAVNFNAVQSHIKDLINSPANIVHAARMAEEAKKIAKTHKLKVTIHGQKQLEKLKAGGILGVNQGSVREAKMIVLEYNGGKKTDKPIIIVGKGVIFDTGGYNLKPTGFMETMFYDMAGAATVFGVMALLKTMGIQKNVIAITPFVENLVSGSAYRPSDILTMLSGHTVEITNTDAEGRLILADALHYGTRFNPQALISIATLTGAVDIALGSRFAGMMGNDQSLLDQIQAAGKKVDELVWQLPLHEDYRPDTESKIADLKNCDISSKGAATIKAAMFLDNFVAKKPWAHLDIGGSAWANNPKAYQTKGATTHGLKLLLKYLAG